MKRKYSEFTSIWTINSCWFFSFLMKLLFVYPVEKYYLKNLEVLICETFLKYTILKWHYFLERHCLWEKDDVKQDITIKQTNKKGIVKLKSLVCMGNGSVYMYRNMLLHIYKYTCAKNRGAIHGFIYLSAFDCDMVSFGLKMAEDSQWECQWAISTRIFLSYAPALGFASSTIPSFVIAVVVLYGIWESIHAPTIARERFIEQISSPESSLHN